MSLLAAPDLFDALLDLGAEHVVVGEQAAALRGAAGPSSRIELLVRPSPDNVARVREAIHRVTGERLELAHVCGRDFQAGVRRGDGVTIDVRLRLFGVPGFEAGLRNASALPVEGAALLVLELPAQRAAARTGVAHGASLRAGIEAKLRGLLAEGRARADEVLLAACLDASVATLASVAPRLEPFARATAQPLLQARLLALGPPFADALRHNPALHPDVAPLAAAGARAVSAIARHRDRFDDLLGRLPLWLPPEGYRVGDEPRGGACARGLLRVPSRLRRAARAARRTERTITA